MKELFMLDKEGSHLNHGSYGAAPKSVVEKRFELIKEQELQPDIWLRSTIYKYYSESVTSACKVVNSKKGDLVIVDNTTTGIECILNSLNLSAGDKVLIYDGTYMQVKKKVKDMQKSIGVEIVTVPLKYPILDESELVDAYRDIVANNDIKVAIVDHISSPLGFVFPVAKITKVLHEHNIIVIIDGAHAPGHVEIDVEQIDADFYVGNFHKWMYAAHSSAFLWCKPKYQDLIKPLVVSKHWEDEFSQRFIYLGTRDTTNYFTIPTAIDFHNSLGGIEGITSYTRPLLDWASDYLCQELKTQALAIPSTLRAPNILLIKYPGKYSGQNAFDMMVGFYNKYSVQVSFIPFPDKSLWIRLMANVYTTKDDFIRLKDALLDYTKND